MPRPLLFDFHLRLRTARLNPVTFKKPGRRGSPRRSCEGTPIRDAPGQLQLQEDAAVVIICETETLWLGFAPLFSRSPFYLGLRHH